MKLKLILANLDGLEPAIAALYEKDGDTFKLKIEGEVPDVEGLKTKNAELLDETKRERAQRVAAEKALADAETERQKQSGDFQALYETSQAELTREREAHASAMGKIREKDVSTAAMGLASSLTRDTARAALLQKEAASFIKYGETGVTYEMGGIPVTQEKVVEHIKSAYPFLVDGNPAGGGGAPGGAGGAGATSGNMGGTKADRIAAIAAKHPELASKD